MHTYDDNCEFEWINLYENIDHYFLVHVVNWFLATLVLRNRPLLHFWSILDEFIGIFFFFNKL
jgi:phosphatidylserine synthase 2